MSDSKTDTNGTSTAPAEASRRTALRRLGRFAAVTPPAIALLLAVKSRPASAAPVSVID